MYCFLFSNSIEPMCRHLRKGLEQGNLKKALVNVEWNICQDCKTDNKVKDKSEALGENAAPAAAAAVVIRSTLNRKTFHSFVKVPGDEQGI